MVDSKENYKFDLGVKKLGRLKKVEISNNGSTKSKSRMEQNQIWSAAFRSTEKKIDYNLQPLHNLLTLKKYICIIHFQMKNIKSKVQASCCQNYTSSLNDNTNDNTIASCNDS